jgi:hypothetical protein
MKPSAIEPGSKHHPIQRFPAQQTGSVAATDVSPARLSTNGRGPVNRTEMRAVFLHLVLASRPEDGENSFQTQGALRREVDR